MKVIYSLTETFLGFYSLDWFISFHLVYVSVSRMWLPHSTLRVPSRGLCRERPVMLGITTFLVNQRYPGILYHLRHSVRNRDLSAVHDWHYCVAVLFSGPSSHSRWPNYCCEQRFHNVVWSSVRIPFTTLRLAGDIENYFFAFHSISYFVRPVSEQKTCPR